LAPLSPPAPPPALPPANESMLDVARCLVGLSVARRPDGGGDADNAVTAVWVAFGASPAGAADPVSVLLEAKGRLGRGTAGRARVARLCEPRVAAAPGGGDVRRRGRRQWPGQRRRWRRRRQERDEAWQRQRWRRRRRPRHRRGGGHTEPLLCPLRHPRRSCCCTTAATRPSGSGRRRGVSALACVARFFHRCLPTPIASQAMAGWGRALAAAAAAAAAVEAEVAAAGVAALLHYLPRWRLRS